MWILPDRKQRGPRVIKNGVLYDQLISAIDVNTLPPELILGIPTELFKSNPQSGLMFAQYARCKSYSIFSVSIASGKDKSGRGVYLTNLQVLDNDELPVLQELKCPEECIDELGEMEKIRRMFNENSSESMKPVVEMLKAVDVLQGVRTFCSHDLYSSANEPNWMPRRVKKNRRVRKAVLFLTSLIGISASLIYMLIFKG